jgi:hypothetical protein
MQGYHVSIECKSQYHSLFEMVSYCRPLLPNTGYLPDDCIIDLQIWPNRYNEYRESKLKWMDFVYSHPAIKDSNRKIVFDRFGFPKPQEYLLVCPFGKSQCLKYPPQFVIQYAKSLYPNIKDVRILSDDPNLYEDATARNIPELITWIAVAKEVVTINSAPSIIANAMRYRYDHIYQSPFDGQDDTACEGISATLRDLTPFL